MATIDPTTIDSSETLNQLRIDARQFLPEVLKSIKKITKSKWEEKSGHLEKGFRNLLYAESVYQKIKVKFLYIALNTAEQIAAKVQEDPVENAKLIGAFSELTNMLTRIDTENAYEERKATNMRTVSRQVLSKIRALEKSTKSFIASNSQRFAANDNARQDRRVA
ncbi:hypothetical protein ISS07_03285 [Candidatus Woesearchaeota archaeon]|nr:hypothetical protein [Candidatus Woesearchaeota archaeon]